MASPKAAVAAHGEESRIGGAGANASIANVESSPTRNPPPLGVPGSRFLAVAAGICRSHARGAETGAAGRKAAG